MSAQQYGHGRNEPERVGPDRVSPLDERRQRALEAADDARGIADYEPIISVAIETATRVRITDEAVALAIGAERDHFAIPRGTATLMPRLRQNLADALRELGFEVEE